jgi:hypothetical protein
MSPVLDDLPRDPDQLLRHLQQMAEVIARQVEPLAWLTDVLERMVSGQTRAHELARLLPWTWQAERLASAVDNSR